MKPDKVDVQADCRKMSCPMPILTVKRNMKKMEVGQIIEMIATDPGSVPDVKGWANQTGNELVHHEQVGTEYFFYIKKTK